MAAADTAVMGAPVGFVTGLCFFACKNPKIPMIPADPGAPFFSSETSPCPEADADADPDSPVPLVVALVVVLVLAIAAKGLTGGLELVVAVVVAAIAPLLAAEGLTACACD